MSWYEIDNDEKSLKKVYKSKSIKESRINSFIHFAFVQQLSK
jgi:hypothetical protein